MLNVAELLAGDVGDLRYSFLPLVFVELRRQRNLSGLCNDRHDMHENDLRLR